MTAGSEGEYRVVPYDPRYDDRIVELQEGLWGRDGARSRAYLAWKYHENPYLDEPLIYLVLHRDTLVAMRGMYGARWVVGGNAEAAEVVPVGGDTIVRADHQSRGMFRTINDVALRDLAERDFPYAFNFSATPATSLRSLRCGWKVVGRYGFATREAPRRRTSLRRPLRALDRISRALSTSVRVTDTPEPDAMARIALAASADERVRHLRDDVFFRWRFRNPMSRYRFLFMGRRPVRGYLVLQWTWNHDPRERQIVDWEADSEDVARALLKVAVRLDRPYLMRTWMGTLADGRRGMLADAGFRPADDSGGRKRYTPGVHVASTRGMKSSDWALSGAPLLDPASWDLRMIFSDGF